MWRAILDTEKTVAAKSGMDTNTVGSQKKNLFALLNMLYVEGIRGDLMGDSEK